jgi:hypothetical protein
VVGLTTINLPSPFVGDIKKAKEGGYYTCESLLMNTRKKLQTTKVQTKGFKDFVAQFYVPFFGVGPI